MKILKREELEAKLSERYNDHPEGWKCFHARDKKGYYAVGWVNRRTGEQYWLKFSSRYSPTCVGFISTFNEDFPFLKDPAFDKDYGIRIVDVTRDEEKKMAEKGSMISSVLKKIIIAMNKKLPEPDDEEKHRVRGPVPNLLVTCLEDISPSQRELEIKMQAEIERQKKGIKTLANIRKQYPSCRVERCKEGYFVMQSRGHLILDKNGNMMDGTYCDES